MLDLEQMRHDIAIVWIERVELCHDLGNLALVERWYPFGASIAAVHGEAIRIAKGIGAATLTDVPIRAWVISRRLRGGSSIRRE